MRAFSLVALLAVAWAQEKCEYPSCYTCQSHTDCGWYKAGPFSDCRRNDEVPATLNLTKVATGMCPSCQAGSCNDCAAHPQGNCSWFTSDIPAVGGKCGENTSTYTGYTMLTTPCPLCNPYDGNCTGCFSMQSSGCNYYTLPGQNAGKCREGSPGFAYNKVPLGYCNGNPCTAQQTCKNCQDYNVSDGSKPCAWFDSKVPALYGAKCDNKDAGVVDSTLYESATVTCQPCAGSSCVACKAESGCKWVAVDLAVGTSFGQCLATTAETPGGKKVVDVCPATCQVYSCTSCIASTACRWYSDSAVPGVDDKCDLATDAWQYGTHRSTVAQGGTCPQCRATRCYECDTESGCGWYVQTILGGTVPGSGECKKEADSPSGKKIEKDSEDCEGNPSGSSAVAPGFAALAAAFFVYHN